MTAGRPMQERSQRIIELASRPEGIASAEASLRWGVSINTASAWMGELSKLGHLYKGKVMRLPSRYFTSPQAAKEWVGKTSPREWHLSLPGTPKPLTKGQVITTAKTKHTQGPNWTHDPRYVLGPGEKPPALFSALGIGRYLA